MDEWFAKVKVRHDAEIAKGLHDADCEHRDNGHFLCHCSKRKREAGGYTEPPGELVWNHPECPRCGNEVDHNGDSFYCDPCKATWPNARGNAEFTDDYGELDMKAWDEAKVAANGSPE